jgi:hypothetical protein
MHKFGYYLPKEVSGNRMDTISETGGHPNFPLYDYYANCFNYDEHQGRSERLAQQYIGAENILSLLGKICLCQQLERKFNTEYYAEKQKKFFTDLGKYTCVRQYNSVLKENDVEKDMDKFMDKLIGRFITLGAYLFLDMRIAWIHDFLKTGRFTFVDERTDASFSYLTRSFFIQGIKHEEPRNPENPIHRNVKQKIYNSLSAYEQECLDRFMKHGIDEISIADWIVDANHGEWLRQNSLMKIWRPE